MYIICIFYIKIVVYLRIMCIEETKTKEGKLNIILASMIIETWVGCVKTVIEHYYESCPDKYKPASNRINPHSGGSKN